MQDDRDLSQDQSEKLVEKQIYDGFPNAKDAETPDIATLASDSTANDPTLNDAETPDGSTTAEPIPDKEPTLDENSTPLISKFGLKPIVIANSPQEP